MDWGFSSSFPESRLLFLLPLLLVLIMAGRCEGCRLEQCTREYDMAREEQGIADIGPTPESCRLARAYQKCVGSTSKSCRGDINFHFVVSMLERLITRHDCVNLLHKPPKGGNGSVTEASVTAAGRTPPPASSSAAPEHRSHHPHPHTCTFNGRHRFRHCGLFGDPHLKTFDNEYQTCRVRGAWPLIDNPYLAVQVTNEPVVEGSPATATTKVTVIVRGSNRTCSPEKTYEAQSDSPLPLVFIDGTQRSGPEENVLLTVHDEGQRVEIWARHIATRVIVRRAGRYLALSVQLPEELALSGSSGLQLCVRGCPASERLDPDAARGQALPREVAMARCRRHMPSVNLSAPYLDWCVFDVMTTGDGAVAEEFVAAAHSAQEDVVRLDPGSLNGTSPGFEPNAAFSAFSAGQTLLLILTLLAALVATT